MDGVDIKQRRHVPSSTELKSYIDGYCDQVLSSFDKLKESNDELREKFQKLEELVEQNKHDGLNLNSLVNELKEMVAGKLELVELTAQKNSELEASIEDCGKWKTEVSAIESDIVEIKDLLDKLRLNDLYDVVYVDHSDNVEVSADVYVFQKMPELIADVRLPLISESVGREFSFKITYDVPESAYVTNPETGERLLTKHYHAIKTSGDDCFEGQESPKSYYALSNTNEFVTFLCTEKEWVVTNEFLN